jgi:hypothetical protein
MMPSIMLNKKGVYVMLTKTPDVDEIIADVLNAQHDLIVEDAVDEYLLAEKDILTEAVTAADRIADLEIDSKYSEDTKFLEDNDPEKIEIDAFIDASITDDIDEDDLFQDTLDDCDFYDDDEVIEDVEDVLCPYEDIEALCDDEYDYLDSLIDGDPDVDF